VRPALSRRVLALLLALAAARATGAPGAEPAAAPRAEPDGRALLAAQPPERLRALLEKKVLLEGRSDAQAQVARAYVIFDQPVRRVFRLLSQTTRQKEYRPELDSIETVEWLPDGTVDEHHLRMMFLDIRYRLRNRVDSAKRRIQWELAPGFESDLKRVEGAWELYALEGRRTLGVFSTVVEVGAGLPTFLQDYVTRKNLPRTLERCRRWVDARGRGG
jgi:hypothetical protein